MRFSIERPSVFHWIFTTVSCREAQRQQLWRSSAGGQHSTPVVDQTGSRPPKRVLKSLFSFSLLLLTLRSMPCTRARSSHTRQRTSSYDEPSAARRPRRGRAHSSAPRGRRAPSLQSTLFIAAPQGHSGRNHSVWGTRAATRHRKRHPPSCVVDPPRASFRPAPLPTDLRPRILYRPPPPAGSYNLRSGSCTYLTP